MLANKTDRLYAVITGDIVDSSKAGKKHHALLLDTLKRSFERSKSILAEQCPEIEFDIFRGDSFQGVIKNPEWALTTSFIIRSHLRKEQPGSSSFSWDARTAIGIGTIDYLPDQVSEGDGEAFRRSGPFLDRMKSDMRLSVVTPWKEVNEEMKAPSALLDAVIAKWSPQQAEIIPELLAGKPRKTIAREFDISQAAVHYRVKGAGWFAIEKFLDRYRGVLKQKLNR